MKTLLTHRQNGSTMIEVLVSMVIIALGLLGFAGLLAQSLKSSNTAYLRSQATFLAYDIVERMRANRDLAIAGNYSIALDSTPTGGSIAGNDLVDWRANITQSIPAGAGSVAADISGNVTITIQWDERGDGNPTQFITQSTI